MTDAQFLQALESCTLPAADFGHRNHVRAAYLYLSHRSFGAALDAMCATLKRYVAHLGCADRYHETVTIAFMTLVNAHRRESAESWEEFIARNPRLLDSQLLGCYYSEATLAAGAARRRFVLEPRLGGKAAT